MKTVNVSLCFLLLASLFSVTSSQAMRAIPGREMEISADLRHSATAVARLCGMPVVLSPRSFSPDTMSIENFLVRKAKKDSQCISYNAKNLKASVIAWKLRQEFLGKGLDVMSNDGENEIVVLLPEDGLRSLVKSRIESLDARRVTF